MWDWIKDFWDFIKSFSQDWSSRVSGALSVPFTIIALWLNSSYLKISFAVLAILAFMFSANFVWQKQRRRADELEKRLSPNLILAFDPADSACKTPVPDSKNQIATAFRLKVESKNNERIKGCSGKLISIERPFGKKFKHQFIQLTFTPSEQNDTISKTVDYMAPIFLDIINVWHQSNSIEICAFEHRLPNGTDWKLFFDDKGEYVFEIQVGADTGPPVRCKLKLVWTEHWSTAHMEMQR